MSIDDNPDVSTAEVEKQVENRLHRYEDDLYRHHPLIWWVTLLVPPGLIVGALVYVAWTKSLFFMFKLVAAAAITFVALGRLVILMGSRGEVDFDISLTPFQLYLMVNYMDLAAALLVAFHVGTLFSLPYLGKRAHSLVEDARFVLDRFPWMRRATFLGLTLFIAFPLAATGAIGGSILGTLLGLSRTRVFLATISGCLLGNTLLLKFAELIEPIVREPWVRYSSLIVIIGIVILMEWRYRIGKKRYHDEHL